MFYSAICLLCSHGGHALCNVTTFTVDSDSSLLIHLFCIYTQVNSEVQEELFVLLRGQQRELVDLRVQIEAMQSSIMAQVERAFANHQEQERIPHISLHYWTICLLGELEIAPVCGCAG